MSRHYGDSSIWPCPFFVALISLAKHSPLFCLGLGARLLSELKDVYRQLAFAMCFWTIAHSLPPCSFEELRKHLEVEFEVRKRQCKDCGGSQICEHDRIKSYCKDCGGSQICEHDRQKSFEKLRIHLESQFEDGMSWENKGKKPDGII